MSKDETPETEKKNKKRLSFMEIVFIVCILGLAAYLIIYMNISDTKVKTLDQSFTTVNGKADTANLKAQLLYDSLKTTKKSVADLMEKSSSMDTAYEARFSRGEARMDKLEKNVGFLSNKMDKVITLIGGNEKINPPKVKPGEGKDASNAKPLPVVKGKNSQPESTNVVAPVDTVIKVVAKKPPTPKQDTANVSSGTGKGGITLKNGKRKKVFGLF